MTLRPGRHKSASSGAGWMTPVSLFTTAPSRARVLGVRGGEHRRRPSPRCPAPGRCAPPPRLSLGHSWSERPGARTGARCVVLTAPRLRGDRCGARKVPSTASAAASLTRAGEHHLARQITRARRPPAHAPGPVRLPGVTSDRPGARSRVAEPVPSGGNALAQSRRDLGQQRTAGVVIEVIIQASTRDDTRSPLDAAGFL